MTTTKRGFYRNKNQAIYKYLPNSWSSYRDKTDPNLGDTSYTVKVLSWNTTKFEDIYPQKIHEIIRRSIHEFERKEGDISLFEGYENFSRFYFVRAAENEGHADIQVEVNPLVFYCPQCGHIEQEFSSDISFSHLYCKSCKSIRLKQLQFLYSCTCGYAAGITLPDKKNNYKYFPNKIVNGKKATFSYQLIEGRNTNKVEMIVCCPQCKTMLYPKNATDNSNFRSHSVKSVNLIRKLEGDLFKYGIEARKVIISRWFKIINEDQYSQIINNQITFFENQTLIDEATNKAINDLVKMSQGSLSYEMASSAILGARSIGSGVDMNLSDIVGQVDSKVQLNTDDGYSLLSSVIIEYMTILNSRKISIDDAMKNMSRIGSVYDIHDVEELNKKMGIASAQLAYDIEIINSTYGYTRKEIDPRAAHGNGKSLKLIPFIDTKQNGFSVYNSLLQTEGILVEFSRTKIVNWLLENKVITEDQMPALDEDSLKSWFINYISPIDIDSNNSESDGVLDMSASKAVFKLLHTISHSFIKSAGVLSGLDKNSLSELIFPNIPSVFIYANTTQGLPLGALSGMFEQKYVQFLDLAFTETELCSFDPICTDHDEGACASCLYLSDVSCSHFNGELSRHILHGYEEFIGFWE